MAPNPFDRVALLVVLAITFAAAVAPAVDNDLWWHLRSGQWMVAHHRLLGADPFSHTTGGAVRVPYDWLAQLVLYGSWKIGGLNAVAVLTALLAVAGVGLIGLACHARPLVKAGVLGLAALSSTVFWSARPQMFTFVGCAAVVAALAGARRGRFDLRWLVPVFILWSNLHLGWFYGLGILWASAAGWAIDRRIGRRPVAPDLLRRLVLVSGACSAAVLVHPAGFKLYRLVLTQAAVGQSFIQEDRPPALDDPTAWFFFVMVVITVWALVKGRRRATVTEVGLVAATAVAGCTVTRLIPLFATVAAPVLCRHLEHVLPARRPPAAASGRADRWFAAVVVAVAVLAAGTVAGVRLSPANTAAALRAEEPVAAASWIRSHRPPGRLWNLFDWGGYLIWALPDYPVSMDGRADLHADALATHRATLRGEGWVQELDRERINVALVPTATPLYRAMLASPAWSERYSDPMATVFTRRVPIRV